MSSAHPLKSSNTKNIMPQVELKRREDKGRLRKTPRRKESKRRAGTDAREKKRSIPFGDVSRRYNNHSRVADTIIKEPSSKSIHGSNTRQAPPREENETTINDLDRLESSLKGLQKMSRKNKASKMLIDDDQEDIQLSFHSLLTVDTEPTVEDASDTSDPLGSVPTIILESPDDIVTDNMKKDSSSLSDWKSCLSKEVSKRTLEYATKHDQELIDDISKTMSSNDSSLEDLVVQPLDSSGNFYSEDNLISRMEESSDVNTDLYVIHEIEKGKKIDAISNIDQSSKCFGSKEDEMDPSLQSDTIMIDSHSEHYSVGEEMINSVKYTVVVSLSPMDSHERMSSEEDDSLESPYESKTGFFQDDGDTFSTTAAIASNSFDNLENPCFSRLYEQGKRKVQRNRELDLDRRVAELKKSLTLDVKVKRNLAAQRLFRKPIRAEDVYNRLYTRRAHSMNASGKILREAIAKNSIERNHERIADYHSRFLHRG